MSKVADYLLWLWESKGLSVSSMLSTVFRFKLLELGDNHVLRDLIRFFVIDRPPMPPSCDLDVVLRHLISSEYKQLESVSLRTLSKKTLFLVALVTAKRVGELQALSKSVSSVADDVVVSYLPHFVAKTERAHSPLPHSFRVHPLKDLAGDLEEGSLLCPVRALRIYLKRTESAVARASLLFVSPRSPSRAMSKNAISYFVREVISGAGAVKGDEGPPLRAHSIHGISTSAHFLQNWSVSKVLEAATWKSNSVFASFYFKDIQYVFEGIHSLGHSSLRVPLYLILHNFQCLFLIWVLGFFVFLLGIQFLETRSLWVGCMPGVVGCLWYCLGDCVRV